MTRGRFIRVIYFASLVAPIRFLRYQWAYFQVNTLGQGKNVYVEGDERDRRGDSAIPARGWGRCLGLPTSSGSTC